RDAGFFRLGDHALGPGDNLVARRDLAEITILGRRRLVAVGDLLRPLDLFGLGGFGFFALVGYLFLERYGLSFGSPYRLEVLVDLDVLHAQISGDVPEGRCLIDLVEAAQHPAGAWRGPGRGRHRSRRRATFRLRDHVSNLG